MNPFNTKEDAEAILAYTGCKITDEKIEIKRLQINGGHHDLDLLTSALVVGSFILRSRIKSPN